MKIVIIEPLGITRDALQTLSMLLKADGHEVIAYNKRAETEEELISRVRLADVIMLANQPIQRNIIEKCERLKLVDIAFTGIDHVDVLACKENNITICNAAGYSTNAVAELAFGLMIGLFRKIKEGDNVTRMCAEAPTPIGHELCGKKLGIIGTGNIGLKIAEIGKVFGCDLLAYSRTIRPEGLELGIKYMDLEEVFRKSDIISIHLPMTTHTKGFIDQRLIGLMKPSAVLINTARGGIVDNYALAKALEDGKIAGAGIDVFEEEPPLSEDYPLLKAPNTVLTPHIAYSTKESLYKRAVIVFDNLRHWLEGNPKNVV